MTKKGPYAGPRLPRGSTPGPMPGLSPYAAQEGDYSTHYQQELVQCGKTRCRKCSASGGHGPYWYEYHYNPSLQRVIRKYRGKLDPRPAPQLPSDSGPLAVALDEL